MTVLRIALLGAHRTGKTTLAQEYASNTGVKFQPISISSLQAEIGYNSSNQSYSFAERMVIQNHLLNRLEEIYESAKVPTIYDRSPIDLIGYTTLAVGEHLTPKQSLWYVWYVQACINLARKYLDGILMLRPGIPLVDSPTSAKACPALIKVLDLVFVGSLEPQALKDISYIMPLDAPTDMAHRIDVLTDFISQRIGKSL